MSLPKHVKEEIYAYVCYTGAVVYLGRERSTTPTDSMRCKTLSVRFLRTCQQIHQESTPVLYTVNVFAITSLSDTGRLLTTDMSSVANLRTVRIRNVAFNDPHWHHVLENLLPQMVNLQNLEISCKYDTSHQGLLDLLSAYTIEGDHLSGMMALSKNVNKVTIRMSDESYQEVFEEAWSTKEYGLKAGGALRRQQAIQIETEQEGLIRQ